MGKADDQSMQEKLSVIHIFRQDYIELVNNVQRHAKCSSAYWLKVDQYDNQHCRLFYPFDAKEKTRIKHTTKSSESGFQFRPEAVAKRNDPRLNKHQGIQLQCWTANCNIQLIIDYNACVEYVVKYASKDETWYGIALDAFILS